MDTIFALSSGAAPAGIAVVRVSGPAAREALERLAGAVPEPRKLQFAALRDGAGQVLDRGLVAYLPGPGTATGEDIAELHLHGGRAVVAAVEAALAAMPGLRRAEPGEFTRRAFANGRIDLAEAEGLADLLSAEPELQRRSALEMAGGKFSHRVEDWRTQLLTLSAQVEAVLDFDDEGDVAGLPPLFRQEINALSNQIGEVLAWPHAETLREGFRVALAGPPNAGKSTLFNALVESEAAITSPTAGTTRDVIERPVAIDGVPLLFVDMAGLREAEGDAVEAIGIARARTELDRADLVLWLGVEGEGPDGAWEIEPQIDLSDRAGKQIATHRVSAVTGTGVGELKRALAEAARHAMPKPGTAALNGRQRLRLGEAADALRGTAGLTDPLLIAEQLRRARAAFDALIGRAATEDMLDALFGRFCIGK
jgi:tRNA modification GTPase